MRAANSNRAVVGNDNAAAVCRGQRRLHRLESARRLEGISRRAVARRLRVDVATVKQKEHPSTDLLLSEIYRWEKAIRVPVAELLVESNDQLASTVQPRAHLVRIMKTVMAMQKEAGESPVRPMVESLIEQLVAIMPQLRDVLAWHTVGKRRRGNEYGTAADRHWSVPVPLD